MCDRNMEGVVPLMFLTPQRAFLQNRVKSKTLSSLCCYLAQIYLRSSQSSTREC